MDMASTILPSIQIHIMHMCAYVYNISIYILYICKCNNMRVPAWNNSYINNYDMNVKTIRLRAKLDSLKRIGGLDYDSYSIWYMITLQCIYAATKYDYKLRNILHYDISDNMWMKRGLTIASMASSSWHSLLSLSLARFFVHRRKKNRNASKSRLIWDDDHSQIDEQNDDDIFIPYANMPRRDSQYFPYVFRFIRRFFDCRIFCASFFPKGMRNKKTSHGKQRRTFIIVNLLTIDCIYTIWHVIIGLMNY